MANGIITNVEVVFTQTFAAVPDQWPSPSPGTIGMGTLTGAVGAVRTEQVKKNDAAPGSGGGGLRRWLMATLVAGMVAFVV